MCNAYVIFKRTVNAAPRPSGLYATIYTNIQKEIRRERTAAVAQLVRAFASQAEGWVFESQTRQTLVIKTGSDSSIAKRSAICVSVTGPRR